MEIARYEIPASDKAKLKKNLTDLGITRETLFRSLDALAETINEGVYSDDRGDSYPEPPVFKRSGSRSGKATPRRSVTGRLMPSIWPAPKLVTPMYF